MYNCLEVLTIEIISFVTGISNIDSYLRKLSFTILITSIISFFSEESWISNSSLFNEKQFSGALFPSGRDKINLNKQTRKDISFCCHSMYNFFQDTEQIFQYHSFWLHQCCQLQVILQLSWILSSNIKLFAMFFFWCLFFFIQVYIFWYDLCLI